MRFRLTKRIPMAAGLAGGSSDAAATLRLLAARHPDAATPRDVRLLAARIGADVPFFLDGAGAALVTGVGEAVEPLPPPIDPVGILLLTPPVGASTPAVFRAWDAAADASPGIAAWPGTRSTSWPACCVAGSTPRRWRRTRPRCARPTTCGGPPPWSHPAWGRSGTSLERLLGRPVLLTGSGSTLFGLYPSPAAAGQAARELRADTRLPAVRIGATSSTGPHIETITNWREP